MLCVLPGSPGSPLAPFVTAGGWLLPGGPWTPGSPLSPLAPGPPGPPSLPGNPGSPVEEVKSRCLYIFFKGFHELLLSLFFVISTKQTFTYIIILLIIIFHVFSHGLNTLNHLKM